LVSIARNPNNPWRIAEKYDGGAAKSYVNDVPGETLTARQYKRLKDNGYQNAEAFDEPPELDASPEVEAPPAPPDRPWMRVGGAQESGSFFARVGPGLFNVARGAAKIMLSRSGHEIAAEYIPPAQLATPVLTPAFRILDRHSPIKVDISGSADLADLLQMIAGAEKLIDYWSETAAAHREMEEAEYDEYGPDDDGEGSGMGADDGASNASAPYAGPPDRTPTGRQRKEPRNAGSRARSALTSFTTWRVSGGDRRNDGATVGRSGRGDGGGDAANASANGSANGRSGASLDPERGRAIVRDLLAADAAGRFGRGLG
jgi:hypothetical protein